MRRKISFAIPALLLMVVACAGPRPRHAAQRSTEAQVRSAAHRLELGAMQAGCIALSFEQLEVQTGKAIAELEDGWGNPILITTHDGSVTVVSRGSDGVLATKDDIISSPVFGELCSE